MLSHSVQRLSLTLLATLILLTEIPALAEIKPIIIPDELDGKVIIGLRSRDASSESGQETGQETGPGCWSDIAGAEVPCTREGLPWSDTQQCYYEQQPLRADIGLLEGHEHEVLMGCRFEETGRHFWAPLPEENPPDPQVLLQQALDRMQLEPITIGTYPGTLELSEKASTVVNWNMWLWVEKPAENTWGPISRTVTLNGYSLTATAEVSHIIWDMGNGDTVRCQKGQKWNRLKRRNQKAPTCGYMYTEEGTYPITATTHWTINWAGVGQSGTLNLELSRTETMKVVEIWTFQCATPSC